MAHRRNYDSDDDEDGFSSRPWRKHCPPAPVQTRSNVLNDEGSDGEASSTELNWDEHSDNAGRPTPRSTVRRPKRSHSRRKGSPRATTTDSSPLRYSSTDDDDDDDDDDDGSRGTWRSDNSAAASEAAMTERLRSAGLGDSPPPPPPPRRGRTNSVEDRPPALDTVAIGSESIMSNTKNRDKLADYRRSPSFGSMSSDASSTEALEQSERKRNSIGLTTLSMEGVTDKMNQQQVTLSKGLTKQHSNDVVDSDGEDTSHSSDFSIHYEEDETESAAKASPLEGLGPKALLEILDSTGRASDAPWFTQREQSNALTPSKNVTERQDRNPSPTWSDLESQRAFANSLDRLKKHVETQPPSSNGPIVRQTQKEPLGSELIAKKADSPSTNALESKPIDSEEPDRRAGYANGSPSPFADSSSSFVQSARNLVRSDSISLGEGEDTGITASSFLADDIAQEASQNFAVEHRIFIKAVLDLLAQKDKFSTETDANEIDTIKSGPLRKASHLVRGIWKVKFVEIRRGMFSYYEDVVSKDTRQGELIRKNISLQSDCFTCRPVKIHEKALKLSPGGAIFELTVHGGPKRLWMANSREERRAWIQAIQDATVGGSVIRGANQKRYRGISTKSPYKRDVEMYLRIQREMKQATAKTAYIAAVSKLLGNPLDIPVQWIMKHLGDQSSENAAKAFHDEGVASGVDQLWKDLLRDTVRINGELLVGGSGHAPERMIASLMQNILAFDKSSPLVAETASSQKRRFCISEAQALSYARDVLLCGNRTRSGGDSYYCINTLCNNASLVVIVPSSAKAEPLSIAVSHVLREKQSSMNDRSGWLRTRSKPHKPWKRRYFVLSEGTLSYYEQALPRPHGLRGQMALLDTTLTLAKRGARRNMDETTHNDDKDARDQFIVTIFGKDGFVDRQVLFENEDKLIPWAYSLDLASRDEKEGRSGTGRGVFRKFNLRDESPQPAGVFGSSLKDFASVIGIDGDEVDRRIRIVSASSRGRSTVNVSVKASTEYKVCTIDPQGNEKEDTWATIRANFRQSFQVSGGPNGRIIKGDEIVQIYVLDAWRPEKSAAPEIQSTPRFGAERIRRLRRQSSTDGSVHSSHSQKSSGSPRKRPPKSPHRRLPTG